MATRIAEQQVAKGGVIVTRMWGGSARGVMFQITVETNEGAQYVQLDSVQFVKLLAKCVKALVVEI